MIDNEKKLDIDFPKVSMSIILNAGEARTSIQKAIDLAMEEKFDEAEAAIKEANEHIKNAHKEQTDVMQTLAFNEYNGTEEPVILPMLFVHAQDTIMTIMSEVNMGAQMVRMYERLAKEISQCKK